MAECMKVTVYGLTLIFALFSFGLCDIPCSARDWGIEGRSILCVCNATYCDTVTREKPAPGTFVVYTSSFAGKRFEKSYGLIQRDEINPENSTTENPETEDEQDNDDPSQNGTSIWGKVFLRVFDIRRHQYIEGFGGSVTDAASINWRKLSDRTQINFIDSYFGKEGLEYNLIRVPIGGADFSTHPYTYNELPWNDGALNVKRADDPPDIKWLSFPMDISDTKAITVTLPDKKKKERTGSETPQPEHESFGWLKQKLPMIKMAERAATSEIKVTASTWSPPVWMKTNERITGFGQLKPEFYQAYADYHLRFIEEYKRAEVDIWAVTTTNEPINGVVPFVRFNSLGWFPHDMGRWVAENLGPTIKNSRFNKTLILAVDDQRYLLPFYLRGMELGNPNFINYIDGIAVHYYGNFIPAQILTAVQERYPNKILLSTEACEGAMPWDRNRVEIGSWRRAGNYARHIIDDLNNYVVGWIDWNLCLSETGGPNWADNFVDAPILVFPERDEFIKQPMFYAMGHFSKFIPRGSQRIMSERRSLITVKNLAVLTPQGNIVMVLLNTRRREVDVRIRISATRFIELTMEPQSIKTVEINRN